MIRTPEEQEAYCIAMEDRCQHFEQTIKSTIDVLHLIIREFDTPVFKSLFNPIVERINSVIAYLEATSDNAPTLNGHPINGHHTVKE